MRKADDVSSLRFLARSDPPKNFERLAVAALQKDVERWEQAETQREDEVRRLRKNLRAPLRELLAKDRRNAALKKSLRDYCRTLSKHRPVVMPARTEVSRISSGSINLTVVPPYDFFWTSHWKKGEPTLKSVANQQTGFLQCDVKTDSDDESNGRVRAHLGIFFQPPHKSKLTFAAAPTSCIGFWYALATLADAFTRGKAGLYVYRFKLDGTLDPEPQPDDPWNPPHDWFAETHTELWDKEEDAGPKSPSWSAIPLSVKCDVDTDHFYNLWVWLYTKAWADGEGLFYASGARGEINGFVPSMSMNLKLT